MIISFMGLNLINKMILWLMIVLVITSWSCECRDPVLHRVGGGKYTWFPNFNYTDWSKNETFYAGDWLYFGFDKHLYNVLEVNKMGYENCIDRDFIKNITQGGRDVFQLKEAKPYYFISGRGYCFHGMKLAVYVQDAPPPMQAPIRVTSAGPGIGSRGRIILTFLLIVHSVLRLFGRG